MLSYTRGDRCDWISLMLATESFSGRPRENLSKFKWRMTSATILRFSLFSSIFVQRPICCCCKGGVNMFSILVNHVINFKVDHQEMSLICPSRFPLPLLWFTIQLRIWLDFSPLSKLAHLQELCLGGRVYDRKPYLKISHVSDTIVITTGLWPIGAVLAIIMYCIFAMFSSNPVRTEQCWRSK